MVFSFEKGGKHVHLSVLQVKKVTRALTAGVCQRVFARPNNPRRRFADDAGKFVPVVAFDCRGCEPVKFTIGDGWVVNSPTAEFQDVDLSDDWADVRCAHETGVFGTLLIPFSRQFDDKSKLSVSVMNVRTRFIVHRGPV